MTRIGDFDPFGLNSPKPYHPEGDLKYLCEEIHSYVGYGAKNPKSHEHTFMMLATLMHIADSKILSSDQEKKVISELRTMREDMMDGSLDLHEIGERLNEALRHAKDMNPKIKVLSLLVELEHFFAIHPPQNLSPLDVVAFMDAASIYHQMLGRDLTNIQTTMITKSLEEIRHDLLEKGAPLMETLQKMKEKGEEIEKEILR